MIPEIFLTLLLLMMLVTGLISIVLTNKYNKNNNLIKTGDIMILNETTNRIFFRRDGELIEKNGQVLELICPVIHVENSTVFRPTIIFEEIFGWRLQFISYQNDLSIFKVIKT